MKALTPQELIDLPGAGHAEKHLRETGRWKLLAYERLQAAIGDIEDAVSDISSSLEIIAEELEKEPQS